MIYHPFPPLYDKNSKILVLGSFPSVKSREQQFFYGHPQNRFWKVTAAVFGCAVPATIEEKVLELDYIAEACACQGYDENEKPYVKLVVSLNDKEADEEAIKEKLMTFCKENFEGYACPRKIFVMPELPRTKMEKIDFVKLSDPVPQPRLK